MKEKNSQFFKTYFIIVIIYALVGLIDSVFITGNKRSVSEINMFYAQVVSLLLVCVFILSIIAIAIFRSRKFSKVSFVMPIYHIIATLVLFMSGIVLGIISVINGIPLGDIPNPPIFKILSIISSSFELIFSVYVLNKFR